MRSCVGFRSATTGTIETWRMAHGGEDYRFTPNGPVIVNQSEMLVPLAQDGIGIVEFVAELTRGEVAAGELEPVLESWTRTLSSLAETNGSQGLVAVCGVPAVCANGRPSSRATSGVPLPTVAL